MKEKKSKHPLLINIIVGITSTIIAFTLFALLQHEINTTKNTSLISLFNFLRLIIVTAYILTGMLVIKHGLPFIFGDSEENNTDSQFYQNRHWTTAEINAGAIKRLETERKQHKINLLKYLILKYWTFKIYIPKDKSQWGK